MPLPEIIVAGYRRFHEADLAGQADRFRRLAEDGQKPRALVIACCDSRVDPSVIFDAAVGTLFIVRNVANLVPPYCPSGGQAGTSSAIEFAVRNLGVPAIVVLGHARCGGVDAALDAAKHPEKWQDKESFVARWIEGLSEAAKKILALPEDRRPCELEREGVRISLANLMTFPFVKEGVEAGALTLHGARFGIATGILEEMDPQTGVFAPVACEGEPI